MHTFLKKNHIIFGYMCRLYEVSFKIFDFVTKTKMYAFLKKITWYLGTCVEYMMSTQGKHLYLSNPGSGWITVPNSPFGMVLTVADRKIQTWNPPELEAERRRTQNLAGFYCSSVRSRIFYQYSYFDEQKFISFTCLWDILQEHTYVTVCISVVFLVPRGSWHTLVCTMTICWQMNICDYINISLHFVYYFWF